MQFPLAVPGFESRQLAIELPGIFSGAKLIYNGQAAPKGPGRGQFLLLRSDGSRAAAQLKTTNFLDPLPQVVIDGKAYKAAEPLKWYHWVWIALPLLLVFIGGALGGALGGAATAFNARVFRTSSSRAIQFLLSSLISEVAVVLYFRPGQPVQLARFCASLPCCCQGI